MPRQSSSEPLSRLGEFRADERLAVFGSLRPGASNAHVLSELGGVWFKGSVAGVLKQSGWAATQGYPGIRLCAGSKVDVHLLCSHGLPAYWDKLDAFEGEDYRRVTTVVMIGDQGFCAQIYELAKP